MQDFINTVDELGAEEAFNLLISGDMTELKDDHIDELRQEAFYMNSTLKRLYLPNLKQINAQHRMLNLELLQIHPDCTMSNPNNLLNTGLWNDILAIFVPDESVQALKNQTNFVKYADIIYGNSEIEDVVWTETEIEDDLSAIIDHINNGTAAQRYRYGQYKSMDFGVNGQVRMQIVGKNMRELSNSTEKAQLEWMAMDPLLPTCKFMNENVAINYLESNIKNVIDTAIWESVPAELKSAIKETKMVTMINDSSGNVINQESVSKLRIPSFGEMEKYISYAQVETTNVYYARKRLDIGYNYFVRSCRSSGKTTPSIRLFNNKPYGEWQQFTNWAHESNIRLCFST